jgi:hypothetical protein
VTRNGRGKALFYYEKLLSLLITGGVMMEGYYEQDRRFVEDVVAPAFDRIAKRFGHIPLISDMLGVVPLSEDLATSYFRTSLLAFDFANGVI